MLSLRILLLGLLFATSLAAQNNVQTSNGNVVSLRALDTLTGVATDLEIAVGETLEFKRLVIHVQECRYPETNETADAFAYMTIWDIREEAPRFDGWMIASSPALSAMDHPRYDVWLLSCNTSEG